MEIKTDLEVSLMSQSQLGPYLTALRREMAVARSVGFGKQTGLIDAFWEAAAYCDHSDGAGNYSGDFKGLTAGRSICPHCTKDYPTGGVNLNGD